MAASRRPAIPVKKSSASVGPSGLAAAIAAYGKKDFANAIALCKAVIAARKDAATIAKAWSLMGACQRDAGQSQQAVASLTQAAALLPKDADVQANLGLAYFDLNDTPRACAAFRAALALAPSHPAAGLNLGLALLSDGQFGQALAIAEGLLAEKKSIEEAINIQANSLVGLDKTAAAIAVCEEATQNHAEKPGVWFTLGQVLIKCNRFTEAMSALEACLTRNPKHGAALANMGIAHWYLYNYTAAVTYWQKALALTPRSASLLVNLGAAYRELGESKKAEDTLKAALALAPHNTNAHNNLGGVYRDSGRPALACDAYRAAIAQDPKNWDAWSNLFFASQNHAAMSEQMRWDLLKDYRVALHAAGYTPQKHALPGPAEANRKLRVGLVSGDFKSHSVSYFISGLLTHYDRSQFAFVCFANQSLIDDRTKKFQTLVDGWHFIFGMPDTAVSALIASERIDILIDLSGHTAHNRLPVFCLKPAPLQLTWLGYPDSTGLPEIDYRLTDNWADPEAATEARFYAESLVRLPTGFLCFSPPTRPAAITPPPCLKNGFITFGSFNATSKITPEAIALWSSVLQAHKASRLILKSLSLADAQVQKNIVTQFKAHGIAASRLTFLGRLADQTDHLEAYNQIDIALDSFPYHGTTTTCEALWMGVPVLSLQGSRHVSRVGASLLSQLNLHDCIAQTPEAFVAATQKWAADPTRLAHFRKNHRATMEASVLCDAVAKTMTLQNTLRHLWEKTIAASTTAQAIDQALTGYKANPYAAAQALLGIYQADPAPEVYAPLWKVFTSIGANLQGESLAIEFLRAKLQENAKDYVALIALGNMLRRAGQTQEALNAYKAALLSQPELPFASSRIGCLLAVLGHFAQADAIFKIIGERYGGREKILRFGDDFLGAANAQHHAQSERFRQMLAGADDIDQAQVVIHASCDSHYFGLFADVFCAGIARYSGLHALVVLHVVGPSVETKAQVAQLRKAYPQLPLVILEDSVDLSTFGTHAKTYYACARFLSLPAVLEKYQRPVLTLDIDTLILQPLGAFIDQLFQSQAPFALIKGEPLEPWGYYWAGAVWARPTSEGVSLANHISGYITGLFAQNAFEWFADQAALFAVLHPREKKGPRSVHTIDQSCMNSQGSHCLFWSMTHSQSTNHSALASDLYRRHRLFAAQLSAEAAVTQPPTEEAYNHRFSQGVLLFQEGKAAEAAELFNQLVHDYPTLDKAWNNLGLSQVRLGKLAEARESYKKAIALAPNSVSALSNYASLLINAGELAEAEQHLLHALSLEKTHVQSIVNYALLLAARREFKKSIAFYEQALAVAPDAPDVLTNYAAALMELGQYSSAMLALRRSQKARPHAYADRANLAHCLTSQGRIDEALAEYGDGSWMESAPMQAHSNRLLTMQYSDKLSQEEIFQAHVQWGQRFGGKACYDFPNWKAGKKRPRIGFVSSDFNAHPVGFFILPVLEGLRGAEIDVYLYPSNAFTDPITAQIRSLCDVWRPIVALPAKAAADVIYQDKIDLLVDLNGHTRGNRLDVFALKPAPKQATWIGYPDTTGLPEMDYRFVDSITDPPGEADRWCTEKLIRLDPCFLVYKPIAQLPEITPAPHVKNGYLTFGSFNNISKISPTTIDIWSRILTQHEKSRLLMKATATSDEGVKERLWAEFGARGIEKARVGFLLRTKTHNEHLVSYNLIDIALDTYPYSGTTTSFEAMSMGVGVLTNPGYSHRSRVTLSIQNACGGLDYSQSPAGANLASRLSLFNSIDTLLNARKYASSCLQAKEADLNYVIYSLICK